jgi:hypothetical protein
VPLEGLLSAQTLQKEARKYFYMLLSELTPGFYSPLCIMLLIEMCIVSLCCHQKHNHNSSVHYGAKIVKDAMTSVS